MINHDKSHTELTPLLRYRQQLIHSGQRALICIEGEPYWCTAQAQALTKHYTNYLWLGQGDAKAVAASRANQFLGQSFEALVVDAFAGFHPNAVAALCGCIHGGGALILLVPPLAQWPQFNCPDYQRMHAYGFDIAPRKGFLARVATSILNCASLVRWQQNQAMLVPCATSQTHPARESVSISSPELTQATPEQQQVIAAINKVAQGRARRPLLLTAPRGRGKSASLGFACEPLLAQGLRIGVVAPRRAAVQALWAACGASAAHLSFFSPDALQQNLPELDLLLVDEAAAIPVPMLLDWLQHYKRAVFATTTDGYEGHGQGFVQRFVPQLQQQYPQAKQLSLTTPIRWGLGCPLEQWLHLAFLLSPTECEALPPLQPEQLELDDISLQQRALQPKLIEQVFSLLVQAHYQTTPDDLRSLLDGPNIGLLIARQQQQVVGAMLYSREGGLPDVLAEAVFSGQRRVRGHLGPQFLSSYGLHSQWLSQSLWRVVRIAVVPQYRSQGVGSILLEHLAARARAHQVEALVSVFAWNAPLIRFWQRAGFRAQAVAIKRDSVSGSVSGVVVQPLTPSAQQLAASDMQYFYQALPSLLNTELTWLGLDLVCELLAALDQARSAGTITHADTFTHADTITISTVLAAAAKSKPLAACLAPWRQWAWVDAATRERLLQHYPLVLRWLWQGQALASLAPHTMQAKGLSSEQYVRQAAQQCLDLLSNTKLYKPAAKPHTTRP